LRFFPLFVLAAVLPFLIGLVVAPPDISFFTRADTEPELRVWLEPANVLMASGATTELAIIAQFDGEEKLIPELSLELSARGGVVVENARFVHSVPFKGRVEIGKAHVRAVAPGNAVVEITTDSISVTAFEGPLKVTTAEAKVIVQQ